MTGPLTRRWVISGWVQGVGFRWWTRKAAERVGVAGWARNQQDGTVEVVARGSPEQLAEMDRVLRTGAATSRVTNVVTEDVPHEVVDSNSFQVKR